MDELSPPVESGPSQPLMFEFTGRATRSTRSETDGPRDATDEYKVVPILNSQSEDIASEIREAVKSSLPPGVSVEVSIQFRPGSIEWLGVVMVLDWMARLSGAGAFLEYLKKAVEAAVNRTVSRHIGRHPTGRLAQPQTSVKPIMVGSPSPVAVPNPVAVRHRGILTVSSWMPSAAMILLAVNTLLLIALVVLNWP